MPPSLSLGDSNSPDDETANLLARREHRERWDNLTAEEQIATSERRRAMIVRDKELEQRAFIAELRYEWERMLEDIMMPAAPAKRPVDVGFV